MKVQEGDRVRVTAEGARYYSSSHGCSFPEGTVGVIVKQAPDQEGGDVPGLGVRYENVAYPMYKSGVAWNIYFPFIAPTMEKPKFSEGDKVRVVKARFAWKEKYVGKTGVVLYARSRMDDDAGCAYVLTFDDGTDGEGYVFRDGELELVVDKPDYAEGDTVRVYQHCNHMEREGTIFIDDRHGDCIRYHDGLNGNGWDYMCHVRFIENITRKPFADVVAPVASTTSQEDGIGRFNGATVDGARFEREGERVTVYVGTRKDSVSTTMTLAHFNEVHRILNEGAK